MEALSRAAAPFMLPADATLFLPPPPAAADWSAWANHASALYVTGRTREAEVAARRALRLGRNPATLLNLAVILETQSRFEEARPLADAALAADPASPLAACLASDAALRAGDFAAAWPLYADSHADVSWLRRLLPEWDGRASLTGARLLVVSAGGFGDSILFARWLPRLRGLGASVTLMAPRSLAPLLAPLADHVIAGNAAGVDGDLRLIDYDCFVCLLALGAAFCGSAAELPSAAYLDVDTRRSPGPAVGIRSRAGEEKFPLRHRTLSAAQASRLRAAAPLWVDLDLADGNWLGTATLIRSLALVVTVDTGVAHLAGALGVPCWVLLPGISAAYYGTRDDYRDRSPFYASQRLFRNGGEGIDDAVSAACAALSARSPA